MNGKLLDYNNENSVEFDDLRNIQLSEKDYGLREFKILCEVHNASRNPEGRFIVELEDGRKGTVLVQSQKPLLDHIEIMLDGEGFLE